MSGAIGDINQGIVGISHTTGTQYNDMPAKKMVKPSAGSTITVHTESALSLDDSGDHLKKFIRQGAEESYSPQEQKELRSSVINHIQQKLEEISDKDIDSAEQLKAVITMLKKDEELEMMAMMARNVLISA